MFAFVLGFLSELARETGDWIDRVLPARRVRRSLRAWRRRRPFWAAVWVIAGGIEMVAIPLAPLPLMIRVGVGAMSAAGIAVVLVAGGIFFLFKPDQRMFVSVVTAVASLTSMATTNLGGFGIGMLAGLIGSSMAFGWMPGNRHPEEGPREPQTPQGPASARPASTQPASAQPAGAAARAERTTGATAGAERTADAPAAGDGASGRPKADEGRARYRGRRAGARGAVLFVLTTALAAAMLPGATGAAAHPGTGLFPLPWPTNGWPWEWGSGDTSSTAPSATPSESPAAEAGPSPTGSASPGATPGPSTGPSAGPNASPSAGSDSAPDSSGGDADQGGGPDDGAGTEGPADRPGAVLGPQVTLPCLTGVDTGGLPNPEPGEMPADPDDLTALRPPVVVGDQPGRPRAAYPVNTVYPQVGADSLTAYGAIVHGATYLGTVGGGQLKVLWVHADRLVADDYTFRLETPGQVQTIDVDLDIPQVDIYVTRLSGSLTIPVIDVATPRICIGADVVPANLPIAVQLPELSVTAVEAGQVLVDAETVNFSGLSAHSHTR
ncbi:DUF6114 domain-containing protein [Streptomyces sp. Root1310]|uniref:DUF6114 domain-containing protein n=1 Tax=Streptomyces sp. Root1310 TaxID=1736452 RepID=UPI00070B54E8|nr:DUF6114 domain-containing protein [Streptomyces sp. Root1310]KQX65282.1 hypothetical protein ASD48_19655 [Streptomyces sp. Root1310]